jgi:molybdopterin molybdotransferase
LLHHTLFRHSSPVIRHPSIDEAVLTEFFHVITADQLIQLLNGFSRISCERIPLDASLFRYIAEDLVAAEDLPERMRSTVDGFAVRAEDTFGASDSIPALLELADAIPMGIMPEFTLRAGQAAPIPTGGFLPRGADAVVMVEYANPAGADSIEVTRSVTARSNVLDRGEDAESGDTLLSAGKCLRAQELGFLAALGITEVSVYRKPRVAVISSGDEVVPIDRKPRLGQIRDANGHSIAALVRSSGAEPIAFDIVPDDAGMLRQSVCDALAHADVVALSGGSSVGTRDLMIEVVSRLPDVEILAHGVAIRPGKPTLLANQGGKAIFGLPGHPVSALVVAQVFLAPFLKYLQGGALEKGPLGHRRDVVLANSVASTIGLEEFVRVWIEEADSGAPTAHPIYGKSGMLSTMVKANGIMRIPMNAEGLSRGDTVQVVQL